MMKISTLIAASFLLSSPAFADSIEERAVHDFIVPGYQAFQQSAADQSLAMGTLCTNNDQRSLDAARASFADLADRWSHVEIIRFGPVLDQNRLERILFWPDRKSIGLKQVQRVIAQKDDTAISIATLQKKSVALQGLAALEFVLHGNGSEIELLEQANFRCHFGLTIASSIHEVAAEIVDEWQGVDGFGTLLISPENVAELYRDKSETMRDILGVVAHGPGIFFDTRLKNYLGDAAKSAKPKSALFWRSGLTFKSLSSNISALGEFAQTVDFNRALQDQKHWVANSYIFEAQNALRALEIKHEVLKAAQSDERSKLEYLKVVLHSMEEIAAQDLAQALGQSTGFSSLDGD
ncbi:imelysin family protein [Maritalea sp.]|uniref:imelysin family protein n=1 Tax=Maritalea sp. TaxID=2003361 RepID=UPI003EF20DDE